jgi:hypothetical protein
MIEYTRFPRLGGVHLEDSFVLAISNAAGQFIFTLDAVQTPAGPANQAPRPGEYHSYPQQPGLPAVTRVEWITEMHSRSTDASGETDLGNIDLLKD